MATDNRRYVKTPYRREETKQILVRFFSDEMDIYEYLKSQPSMGPYIKQLIRDDMELNAIDEEIAAEEAAEAEAEAEAEESAEDEAEAEDEEAETEE